MDQRQRDSLNSAAPHLADLLNFAQFSELLQLAGLVTKARIAEITASVDSNFSRNLKLLGALQESNSTTAFDELVRILEITNNARALQLLSPARKQKPESGGRSILNKLAIKYWPSKSSAYPIGMNSSQANTSASGEQYQSAEGGDNKPPSSQQFSSHRQRTGHQRDNEDNITYKDDKTLAALIRHNFNNCSPPIEKKTSSNNIEISTQTPSRGLRELRIESLSLEDKGDHHHQERKLAATREAQGGGEKGDEEDEPVALFHPYTAQPQSEGGSSPTTHRCIPASYASSNESMSSLESLNQPMESSFAFKSVSTMAIADGVGMSVKKATSPRMNTQEVYKMTARPRGLCLIMNNIDFFGDIFPTRTGSDIDAKRFDEVFTQLHFQVVMKRNLTAEQMKRTFKEVAKECRQEHDALFVFILSHGNEHGIYGVDGLEVYLEEDIISCFDNRRCETMIGKPKVFVIQACRGRNKDYGGGDGDVTDSIVNSPVISTNPLTQSASQDQPILVPPTSQSHSSQGSGGGGLGAGYGSKRRKIPVQTDILLVFSCLHGYVSVRNELAGSWLGTSLSYYIMIYAFKKDFQKILNCVSRDIAQRESSNGHIQAIDVQLRGWNKELYFNPGF